MAQKTSATTAADPQDHGHGKTFPPLDPGTFAAQLVWLALAFGLLYVVLSRVALPRVGEVIEERRERVQRDLDAAEKLKSDTEQALASYEQALAEARAKGNAIAKGMRDELAGEIEAERGKVEAQIGQQLAEAEARIGESKTKALTSVNDIAADIAGAIVTRLIGNDVSTDEVKRALAAGAAEAEVSR
jgi:F-type H+-transporting ATPase subunit b